MIAAIGVRKQIYKPHDFFCRVHGLTFETGFEMFKINTAVAPDRVRPPAALESQHQLSMTYRNSMMKNSLVDVATLALNASPPCGGASLPTSSRGYKLHTRSVFILIIGTRGHLVIDAMMDRYTGIAKRESKDYGSLRSSTATSFTSRADYL